MINDREEKKIKQFYKAVASIDNIEDCEKFFNDVATIKEILDMSSRLEVARLLSEGKVFSEITAETGASSATISRVNKCLEYGGGGYEKVLNKLR